MIYLYSNVEGSGKFLNTVKQSISFSYCFVEEFLLAVRSVAFYYTLNLVDLATNLAVVNKVA